MAELMLLAWPGLRARAYLQHMVNAGLPPAHTLVLGRMEDDRVPERCGRPLGDSFDPKEPLRVTLERAGLAWTERPCLDLHDPGLRRDVAALASRWAVFSGGGILRPELLHAAGRWIHVHPGWLPDERGSTCIYWSLLLWGDCAATAFFMTPGLDTGSILAQRRFTLDEPVDPVALDHALDASIRAQVLVDALERLRERPQWEGVAQDRDTGRAFYIIHPVLKQLALLRAGGLQSARRGGRPCPSS